MGPTAIMALMTGAYTQYGEAYAVLLAFLNGIIVFTCGVLQLGGQQAKFLMQFIR